MESQRSRFSLNGKISVVTGGHRGIGRDISLGLARAGSDIVVIDQGGCRDSDIPDELEKLGRKYWNVQADLGDTEQIKKACDQVLKLVGSGIDILVNNAGIAQLGDLEELSINAWDRTMAVNLRAPFLIAQAFVNGENGMIARGCGSIINVTSAAGINALNLHGAYCASKAGLNMLTKVMTVEWAGHGIRANAIAPTVVMTDMGKQVWGKSEIGDAMLAKIPQNRFAQPFEVADAVVYLSSDASSMINGAIIPIDGGYGCM